MPPTLPSVADLLARAVEEGVAPGIAAHVLARGELVHESWHGSAQLVPDERPLAPGAIFDVASLTKVLCTTTLTALIAGEGTLDLETPVAQLLPGFAAQGKDGVRVRHLLAHTSGLVWWRPYFALAAADPVAGRAFLPRGERDGDLGDAFARGRDLVMRAVLDEPLEAAPGARALYSDANFLTLAWVLESVTQNRLDLLFDQRVVAPLALASTFFIPEHDAAAARARRDARSFVATEDCEHRHEVNCGTVNDDNTWAVGGVAGHAGVFSTPREAARIGQAWLDALHGRPSLVSPGMAARFAAREGPPGSTRALGWDTPSPQASALGTRLGRGPRGAIGHLGFTGTSLWIAVDEEIVCALFTNRVHPSRANEGIKPFRPRFHDAVAAALGI